MYEAHFGLKSRPFSLLPDPAFLYRSNKHITALNLFEYSVTGQGGYCVITGEIGAGKTTLIRHFLNEAPSNTTFGLIANPNTGFGDLLDWILIAFDLPRDTDRVEAYQRFVRFLEQEAARGARAVLIIDEAQNLTEDLLEQLRLLSNVNSDRHQLLQLILVGQPELQDKLKDPKLHQFTQRIAVHHHLAPLTFPETREYIGCRLSVAGATQTIFEEMAIAGVHYFAGGTPRLINSICDMALVYGYANDRKRISIETLIEVLKDREKSNLLILPRRVGTKDRTEIMAQLSFMTSSASKASSDPDSSYQTSRDLPSPSRAQSRPEGHTLRRPLTILKAEGS